MSRPRILFAHGAGAGCDHPWMQAWAERLSQLGEVHTFDYPYKAAGRKAPDRMPKLLAAHRAQVDALPGHGPIVLCGKSMGSRVGCHLSLELPVAALICLGYPLGRAGRPLRDQVLLDLTTPVFFAQGTRDPLAQFDLMEAVCGRMSAPHRLHRVEDGNHSLEVAKRTLRATQTTQADHDQAIIEAISRFLSEHLPA